MKLEPDDAQRCKECSHHQIPFRPINPLITKPAGKTTIAPESDRRPAITINDFNGLKE